MDKIVQLKGDCLDHRLCLVCPFKATCLPDFLDKASIPSEKERFNRALDAIVRSEIMDDDFADHKSTMNHSEASQNG